MPYDRNISGDILEIQDLQDNHASFTFLRHEISRIELNLVDGKDDDTVRRKLVKVSYFYDNKQRFSAWFSFDHNTIVESCDRSSR